MSWKNIFKTRKQITEEADIVEHDIVVSKTKFPNIPVGTSGTVVFVYDDGKTYEVEFTKKGKTIAVETATKDQIEKEK